MTKTRKTELIAITSIIKLIVTSITNLLLGRILLIELGSDFNGINSTINQLVSTISLIEGGFTAASITALFKPLKDNDESAIDGIMSYSNKYLKKIGFIMLVLSLLALLIYVPKIKTSIDTLLVFVMFLLSAVTSIVDIGFIRKYYIIINSNQDEYISNIIEIVVYLFFSVLIIFVLYKTKSILLYRITHSFELILSYFIVAVFSKRKYKNIKYNSKNIIKVSGTKDLFVGNIMSVLYTSLPVLTISSTEGTIYTSIYAIYNSIFSLIKQAIYVLINSPRNAFGKLFVEKKREETYEIFKQFELVTIMVSFILLPISIVLASPFVGIYTRGVADANYNQTSLPLIIGLITIVELIHIPSGICIYMKGDFKAVKYIQLISCICICTFTFVGNFFYGFFGLLVGILISNIVLALLEITYARKRIFGVNIIDFAKVLIINISMLVICYVENSLLQSINNYSRFFIVGVILVLINSTICFLLNYVFNKKEIMKIVDRLLAK